MKVKKCFFPVLFILIIFSFIVVLSLKKEKTPTNQENITENKITEVKIGDKEVVLTIKKIEGSLDTPYSLVAKNKSDETTYSSQIIEKDILEDFESIKTKNFGDEKLIIIDGLSVGSHSSGLRVFKIDPIKKQIIPICVSQEKQDKEDSCFFYADAMSEPFFQDVNSDNIDELIEMNRSIKDYQVTVLTAVYKYKNGSFIPLVDDEYEQTHQYLSKTIISGTDQPFKLIRNIDNTN